MAKVYRSAAFLAAALLPAAGMAQDRSDDPTTVEVEPARRAGEAAPADGAGSDDGWMVTEHRLRVAPVAEEQPAGVMEADLPERPGPDWPGEHLYRGWDFGTAFSYPQVYPNVGARLLNIVGDVSGSTNYLSRIEAELYLLHFGVSFLESVGGERTDETMADVDLRIPIALGRNHYLSILPGVSYPITDTDKSEETTNVRLQAVYGFGAGGLGLQLRGGVTEGIRPAGLLAVNDRIDGTAALVGGMVSWRIVDVLQLRAEASGEIATVDGAPDRLTLLPGVVFFPWGDPRLHLGVTAVVETVAEDLDEDPNLGGLFDVGIFFY